jgi:hypothetical protein
VKRRPRKPWKAGKRHVVQYYGGVVGFAKGVWKDCKMGPDVFREIDLHAFSKPPLFSGHGTVVDITTASVLTQW